MWYLIYLFILESDLYGTRPDGINSDAGATCVSWSSKNICALNALSISFFATPPRKNASSTIHTYCLSVKIIRLCAGLFLAFTIAILNNELSLSLILDNVFSNFPNGPSVNNFSA